MGLLLAIAGSFVLAFLLFRILLLLFAFGFIVGMAAALLAQRRQRRCQCGHYRKAHEREDLVRVARLCEAGLGVSGTGLLHEIDALALVFDVLVRGHHVPVERKALEGHRAVPGDETESEEKGPKDLPVARRRDGWSFLLADAEEMQRLNRVTLDGETVLVQIAGELVDVSALSWASEVTDTLAPQIAQFNRLLESTGAQRVEDLGIPAAILQEVVSSKEWEGVETPRF